MNKEETPKRKNHGPMGGGPGVPGEKAKDFKKSIKRLFKELKNYKIVIAISLFLAVISSILSIIAPNKLSKLTDEITNGLILNQKELTKVTKSITSNLSEDILKQKIPQLLEIKMDKETISTILISDNISNEDKTIFKNFISSADETTMMNSIKDLPDSILEVILPDSTYNNIVITTNDKKTLLSMTNMNNSNFKEISLTTNLQNAIFNEIEVSGVKISSKDQYKFLKTMSSINKKSNPKKIYKQIDKLPSSIQKLVRPKMKMNAIKNIVIFLVILYLCSALFSYIQSISMTNVSNNFARDLRKNISTKINRLPLKYFDKHSVGDTLSRVTNDIDTIAQSMNQSLAALVSNVALFIGTLIMMICTNWILALTAILSSIIGFIGMFIVLSKSQKYFISRQEELGNLNGHIEEVYSGLNVIKAYNGKKESDIKFDELNKKVQISNQKSQFYSGIMMPMMNFIGNFGYVAVCIVGALLTVNGNITFGVIVAFITYVRLFTSPLSQIAQATTALQSTAAASERVFEFMDEKEMKKEIKNIKYLSKDKIKGEIEFENVSFKYDGNKENTIKDFTAVAKKGQKIAIVGPTGAGKTTMVNLLMKFYDINSGDIKIDGISTNNLTRDNIHELFTMVLQDTWLFNGTIKENIIYNRKDTTDEEVKKVCKEVGLDHFIKTLPHGYNSKISDNDSVSAGQRQLLTIARGMIEDSPFLILDEATSNVDTRTEELVQIAMDKLLKGKTSFIIAHRLSTIKNADLILVMNEGNIIEQGNHNQLIKKNGFYAKLYNSQFENTEN